MPLNYTLAPVNKSIPEPMIAQIVELVRTNIELESLEIGERLPTEREMAERLGVARGTVKAAYHRLEQQNMIRTRQGSGSYVVRDEQLTKKLRKEKAIDLLHKTLHTLIEMGLSTQEISHLFEALLCQQPKQLVLIAIVCSSPELLTDLRRQLSFLPGVMISIFILESITDHQDPESMLRGFDLILIPSSHFDTLSKQLKGLHSKLIEAAIAPTEKTLVHLSALPRDARIGIICQSAAFLAIVKEQLRIYGFDATCIQSFFEMDYTTETYFPGGIDVLISFNDAHIFTNPAFIYRNEEFWAKGGQTIAFQHQLERGTLIYLERQVRSLIVQNLEEESTF